MAAAGDAAPAGQEEAITVAVRLRPFVGYEAGQKACVEVKDNQVVNVIGEVDAKGHKTFAFDVAMDSSDPDSPDYVNQEKCYELVGKRMVDHMLQGFNTCLFCYGQTGTGKTTTIMGEAQPKEQQGLLMRLIDDVFVDVEDQRSKGCEVHVTVQMMEVYNEKLNDLLVPVGEGGKREKRQIDIRVHPELGVYLNGATTAAVNSTEDCIMQLNYGNTMKSVRATAMNKQSSRGHTIFRLNMERSGGDDNRIVQSEVYFADLAGRENERTTQVTGDGRIELMNINKSLMFLATCIQSLGEEGKKKKRAPTPASGHQHRDMAKFRNSKLTLLLSNALSGNSKTAMIGTLSPAVANFDETFSTLKFAATVKSITLAAKPASATDKESIMKSLRDEVEQLKAQLAEAKSAGGGNAEQLAMRLQSTDVIGSSGQKSWAELHQETQTQNQMRTAMLKRVNTSGGDITSQVPCLANYAEDVFLAFRAGFCIAPGKDIAVGAGDGADFKLHPGPGIRPITCYVRNTDGKLEIRAAELAGEPPGSTGRDGLAIVEVNAVRLGPDPVELKHHDQVIFGHAAMFVVFLQVDTPEDKVTLLKDIADQETAHDEQDDERFIEAVLGEKRAADTVQVDRARKYLEVQREQLLDSEGKVALKAFMHSLVSCKRLVDEANHITEVVRPKSGLHLELVAHSPVLAFGYGADNFPELSVRLVRHISPACARWRWALRRVMNHGILDVVNRLDTFAAYQHTDDLAKGITQPLCNLPWSRFLARLEVMRDIYEDVHHHTGRTFEAVSCEEPAVNPWTERNPNAMVDHHHPPPPQPPPSRADGQGRPLVTRAGPKELWAQLAESRERERRLSRELEAAQKELQAMRLGGGKDPIVGALPQLPEIGTQLTSCLELSKANQALAENLAQLRCKTTMSGSGGAEQLLRSLGLNH